MPKADVAEIISAVADALDHAHSRGLLHRDVKPANILLTSGPRRRILLADFGIAREMGEISGLTATNMLVGTTAYCAPEQLQGNDLDARADQYALGCTAFNLLTGVAPFQHSNPAVVISQHLSAPPPLVSERRPELAELDAVIAKAMAKNPTERYATCADFASALAGQASSTAPAGPTEVIAARIPAGCRGASGGRPAMVIAALVAVALVAVAAVVGVRMLGARGHHGTSSPSASVAPPTASAAPPHIGPGDQADQPDHRSVGRAGPPRAGRRGQSPHQALRRARHPPVGGVCQQLRRHQAVAVGRGHHARPTVLPTPTPSWPWPPTNRPTPSGCPTR